MLASKNFDWNMLKKMPVELATSREHVNRILAACKILTKHKGS